MINSHSEFCEVRTLAKNIDDDILNNAGYIDLEVEISLPKIDSIRATDQHHRRVVSKCSDCW